MKNVLVIVTLSSCLMACSSLPFLKSSSDVAKTQASDVMVDNEYGQQELETANVDVVDTDVAQAPVTEKPMDAHPESEVGEAAQEEAHSYSSVQEMEMPAVDQSIASAAPMEPVIEQTEVPMAQTTVKSSKVKQVQKKKHFATKLPEKKLSKKEKLALNKKAKAAKNKIAKADKKSAIVCKKVAKNGKKLSKREIASCEKKAKLAAKAKYKKVARK